MARLIVTNLPSKLEHFNMTMAQIRTETLATQSSTCRTWYYLSDQITGFILMIIGGMISNYLYDQIKKHNALVKKILSWAGYYTLMYFMCVGGVMFMQVLMTYPLDAPLVPWQPALMWPLSTYFMWGIVLYFMTLTCVYLRNLAVNMKTLVHDKVLMRIGYYKQRELRRYLWYQEVGIF